MSQALWKSFTHVISQNILRGVALSFPFYKEEAKAQ
jgi:hypothetical protein